MKAPGLAATIIRQIPPCCAENCFGLLVALAFGIGAGVGADGTLNFGSVPAGQIFGQHTSQKAGLVTLGPTTATLSGVSCTWWYGDLNPESNGWLAGTSLASLASRMIAFGAF